MTHRMPPPPPPRARQARKSLLRACLHPSGSVTGPSSWIGRRGASSSWPWPRSATKAWRRLLAHVAFESRFELRFPHDGEVQVPCVDAMRSACSPVPLGRNSWLLPPLKNPSKLQADPRVLNNLGSIPWSPIAVASEESPPSTSTDSVRSRSSLAALPKPRQWMLEDPFYMSFVLHWVSVGFRCTHDK